MTRRGLNRYEVIQITYLLIYLLMLICVNQTVAAADDGMSVNLSSCVPDLNKSDPFIKSLLHVTAPDITDANNCAETERSCIRHDSIFALFQPQTEVYVSMPP